MIAHTKMGNQRGDVLGFWPCSRLIDRTVILTSSFVSHRNTLERVSQHLEAAELDEPEHGYSYQDELAGDHLRPPGWRHEVASASTKLHELRCQETGISNSMPPQSKCSIPRSSVTSRHRVKGGDRHKSMIKKLYML